MASLAFTGLGALTSIGLATAIVVLSAVAAATTLLPALLGLLGDRIDTGRLVRRHRPAKRAEETAWWRFAHRVSGRPWPYLIGAVFALLAFAAPAFGMQTAWPAAGDAPSDTTYRQAYDLLDEGFGPGINGPLVVVVDLEVPGVSADEVSALAEDIRASGRIASVSEPQTSADGSTVVFAAMPTTGPADLETSVALAEVRDVLPDNVYVTGLTAMTTDLNGQLSDTLPLFMGAVLVASFLLLMLVFRSVVVPLKAVVMNMLSIGAAYGVLVAVFQWGWGSSLIGLEGPTPITSLIIVIMFPILFGLSMDYEVFLISRIREEYDPDRRQHRVGRPRHGRDRPGHHVGRPDHDRRLPRVRRQPGAVAEDARPRARHGGPRRRHPRPHGAGAGDDGPAGQGQLVAPRLARQDPAAPDRRGRRP